MFDLRFCVHHEAFTEDVCIHHPIHVLATSHRWIKGDTGEKFSVYSDVPHDGEGNFLHTRRLDNVLSKGLVHHLDDIPILAMWAGWAVQIDALIFCDVRSAVGVDRFPFEV